MIFIYLFISHGFFFLYTHWIFFFYSIILSTYIFLFLFIIHFSFIPERNIFPTIFQQTSYLICNVRCVFDQLWSLIFDYNRIKSVCVCECILRLDSIIGVIWANKIGFLFHPLSHVMKKSYFLFNLFLLVALCEES